MPSKKSQRRIYPLVKKRAREAGIWRDFSARVKAIRAEMLASGRSMDHSLLRATLLAGREFPEIRYDELAAGVRARISGLSAGRKTQKIRNIASKLPKTRAALLRLMSQEEVRIAELRELDRTKRLTVAAERKLLHAKLRKVESQAKREEARVEANKAKARHYYWLKKMKEEQMADAQQALAAKSEARQHGIVVSDPPEVDIVSDTKWVYGNLAKLIIIDPAKGHRKLNIELLQQAPSNGAVAIAMFALENQNEFMTRFAMRLFPKETKQPMDDNPNVADELDPSLSEMANYMGTK